MMIHKDDDTERKNTSIDQQGKIDEVRNANRFSVLEEYGQTSAQGGDDRVYSKIDWAFGNFEWIKDYGHVEADCLELGVLDLSPIVVQIWRRKNIYPKPFKLYKVTMEHKEFQSMVDKVWKQKLGNDPTDNIWQKLQQLKTMTKGLNREMTSYEKRLSQIRQQLEYTQINLKFDPFNQDLIEKEKQTFQELEKWSIIEERVLRQKARVNWIDYGDSNSKYLYAQLKIRASKNSITTVYNDVGARVT
ncbi:PREDICTED: uncharacterized protein LOC109229898 [Nicotiana attenuata]|uniref:uncharacterized protein LOC109229898 n=1 Tax=Nicotiana attenuata TaxID=49451 RepID=UPI0009055C0B|nr:PREDICTED: uncharacterized protein LOC109229898 [Nicotiana attenuata]